MANLPPFTIKSICETNPPHPHVRGGDVIQWHSAPPTQYELHLPGGYFVGYSQAFKFPVPDHGFSGTLTLVATPPVAPIVNYIYDANGQNCTDSRHLANPPDIIIDSGIPSPKKKAVAGKKAAPKKK